MTILQKTDTYWPITRPVFVQPDLSETQPTFDFNGIASVSFLKGLTSEFGKKEKFPLCMFLSKIGQEIMFDDLFLENKPS